MKSWLFLIACMLTTPAIGQQELLLNALTILPQSSATNPGIAPASTDFVLSIPSLAFNYGNNAFTFNQLVKRVNADSAIFDIEGVIGKLHKENIIQYQLNLDLLRFSWTRRNWFFSALITEKTNLKFFYTRDFIRLAWFGNAALTGDSLMVSPKVNASYYREFSFCTGYRFKNISIGVRTKLLSGLGNVITEEGDLRMYTDPDSYAIYMNANYVIKSAGISNFDNGFWRGALNLKNPGYAIDAGVNVDLLPKLSLQASVSNLGQIFWRDDIQNYQVKGVYHFQGIELGQFLNVDTLQLQLLVDTLKQTFTPKLDSSHHRSNLVPRSYVSLHWKPDNKTTFGIVAFSDYFDKPHPAFSIYGMRSFLSFLQVGASIGFRNGSWQNIGASCVTTISRFQLFALSDNVLGAITPKRSKNVNFRVGMNINLSSRYQKL